MTQTLADITQAYPPLHQHKMNKRLGNLNRMAGFYTHKIEQAPPEQAVMFQEFVVALNYATSVIKMHNKLTLKIAQNTKEDSHEVRPSSTR